MGVCLRHDRYTTCRPLTGLNALLISHCDDEAVMKNLCVQPQRYANRPALEVSRSAERSAADAREIHGAAAARGSYVGVARVIVGERDVDSIRPGDVLVCRNAPARCSVLLAKAGALVTDSGGILSNAATLAREHGIPAVMATGNATQIIRDGQRVAVDGDRGIVQILP